MCVTVNIAHYATEDTPEPDCRADVGEMSSSIGIVSLAAFWDPCYNYSQYPPNHKYVHKYFSYNFV